MTSHEQRIRAWPHGVHVHVIAAVATLLLLFSGLFIAGCSPTSGQSALEHSLGGVNGAALRSTRIDAIPGRVLVVPVDGSWRVSVGAVAVLEGDISIPTRWARLRVVNETSKPRCGWIPRANDWVAEPIVDSASGGSLVVVLDVPCEAAGREIRLGGHRLNIAWLPETAVVDDQSPVVRGNPSGQATGLWNNPLLQAFLREEARNPLGRWRVRLLMNGFRASPPSGEAEPPFADPIIETMAANIEDRWRLALEWLRWHDANLAGQVVRRLSLIVDFGDDVIAPAWPTELGRLDVLLSDLLDQTLSAPQRARRAGEWLESLPEAVVWVTDDGGTLDAASGEPFPLVGIANLTSRSTLAWIGLEDGLAPAEMEPLAPVTARVLGVTIPLNRLGETLPRIIAHAGDRTFAVPVRARHIPVLPPGATIGPLVPDYDLNSWGLGAPAASLSSWSAAGLLLGGKSPTLFIECRVGPGAVLGDDAIQILFGPSRSPIAAVSIRPDGSLRERLKSRSNLFPSEVRAIRGGDSWCFTLPVPPSLIERDGTIRIAISRTDPRGVRSAWPQPMFPWQNAPQCRAALDMTAWGDVSDASPSNR